MPIPTRSYGTSGPPVVLLHGGPGAPGYMAPVARRLADSFKVLEPLQRGSGSDPLTVTRHVQDLHELLLANGLTRPALVGSSWGAMLALAYAAAYPDKAGPLALIGCGTFDSAARARMRATLAERTDENLRLRMQGLSIEIADADERLELESRLILPLYSFELTTLEQEIVQYDATALAQTWEDMRRLQDQGVYPAAFAAIHAPVLMLHGSLDPHPGQMIAKSLLPHLPQLEYRELGRCGHYPWLEKFVCEQFFAILREWLTRLLKAKG